MQKTYQPFTAEMKAAGYTILVPNMLPMHFRLLLRIFGHYGYNMELLTTTGPEISDTGLKYVHNDTCYPAILVIGQFIDALQSGKYDPHKVALMLFQTGGGCRASNYISLLRKALAKGRVRLCAGDLLQLRGHREASRLPPDAADDLPHALRRALCRPSHVSGQSGAAL